MVINNDEILVMKSSGVDIENQWLIHGQGWAIMVNNGL